MYKKVNLNNLDYLNYEKIYNLIRNILIQKKLKYYKCCNFLHCFIKEEYLTRGTISNALFLYTFVANMSKTIKVKR